MLSLIDLWVTAQLCKYVHYFKTKIDTYETILIQMYEAWNLMYGNSLFCKEIVPHNRKLTYIDSGHLQKAPQTWGGTTLVRNPVRLIPLRTSLNNRKEALGPWQSSTYQVLTRVSYSPSQKRKPSMVHVSNFWIYQNSCHHRQSDAPMHGFNHMLSF